MTWSSSLVFLAALGLVGCGALFDSGPQPEQPTWVERPSGSLHVLYSVPIVANSRRSGEPFERGKPAIDPREGRVFVGSSDGGLYCLDARDGSTIWRFETVGHVQSEPLFDPVEGALYFGATDGALYKVDARNGQLRYRFASNAEVQRQPTLVGDILYAINSNDTILALDRVSGKLIWTQHRAPAMGMEILGHSGVLVWQDRVFAGFSDGIVMSFDRMTGAERWQPVDLTAEVSQGLDGMATYLDVDTTPILGSIDGIPTIYVASITGGVFALEAQTGAEIWSNSSVVGTNQLARIAEPAHPAMDAGPEVPAREVLIAASGTTGLCGLDPSSGAVLWKSALPVGGYTSITPMQGVLLASASQLGVFLLSPLDGRLIDGIGVVDGVAAEAGVHGNRAFVLTNGGRLLALHVASPRENPPNPDEVNLLGRPFSLARHF